MNCCDFDDMLTNYFNLSLPLESAPDWVQILPVMHLLHQGCSPMLMGAPQFYWGEVLGYEVTGVAIVPDWVHPAIQQVKKLEFHWGGVG